MLRYSQMTPEQLQEEIRQLEKAETKARRSTMPGEEAVIRQKIRLAKSYLTDPDTIQTNRWYEVEEEKRLFHVQRLNGVMAWGYWEGERIESAVPIGILKPVQDS